MNTQATYPAISETDKKLSLSLGLVGPVADISNEFENVYYQKNQVIFREGKNPLALYFIQSGKIKLHKTGSDGKEQIIKIAKSGDFIGYNALLTTSRYNVSATVLENSSIFMLPKSRFINLMNNNKQISDHFLKMLSLDLADIEEKLVSLAYKPVRGRLAESPLSLYHTYQDKNDINISRSDLANMVGTAKETVTRLLTEFKNESLIKISGRNIKILNEQGIKRINNLYN